MKSTYKGSFAKGMANGNGILRGDGVTYWGEWVDGARVGMHWAIRNGDATKELWDDGEFVKVL